MTAPAPPATRPASTLLRPAVRVELSERLYQGVFGVGLATAVALGAIATLVSLLQPPASMPRSMAATCGATLLAALLYRRRLWLYWRLRRRPFTLLVIALALAAVAASAGVHNEQMFYVVGAAIGSAAVATPGRTAVTAAAVVGAGVAAPYAIAGGGPFGVAVATMVVPSLFWLVTARLAEYLLLDELAPVAVPHGSSDEEFFDAPVAPPSSSEEDPAPAKVSQTSDPLATLRHDVRLTPRQLQVVLLVFEGLRHGEIADELGITTKRVRDLLRGARERTSAATTPQLVAWLLAQQALADPRTAPGQADGAVEERTEAGVR